MVRLRRRLGLDSPRVFRSGIERHGCDKKWCANYRRSLSDPTKIKLSLPVSARVGGETCRNEAQESS